LILTVCGQALLLIRHQKGKPDIEAVDTTARLNTVNEIFEVTTKPMIYDADTGGKPEHFEFTVRSLERTGVSAVIIEDKTGLKKNSLFGNEVKQTQDSIENFCHKIRVGKQAPVTKEFMPIGPNRIVNFGSPEWEMLLKEALAKLKPEPDGARSLQGERTRGIFEFCWTKFPQRRKNFFPPQWGGCHTLLNRGFSKGMCAQRGGTHGLWPPPSLKRALSEREKCPPFFKHKNLGTFCAPQTMGGLRRRKRRFFVGDTPPPGGFFHPNIGGYTHSTSPVFFGGRSARGHIFLSHRAPT